MKTTQKTILYAAGCVLCAAGILLFHRECAAGVSRGLSLCAGVLIPALFPFMVISHLAGKSGAARPLEKLAGPLCRRWLHLPSCMGAAVVMGWLGGYPVGAAMIAPLVRSGSVTKEEARRCLRFGVTPALSFAVVTAGAGIFGSCAAGWILWGCHVLTGLALGGAAGRGHRPSAGAEKTGPALPFGTALVLSVSAGVEGMLSICGTVLLFSAGLGILEGSGLLCAVSRLLSGLCGGFLSPAGAAALLTGGTDISCGIFLCRSLDGRELCLLLPFLLSFGSCSVLCQLGACLRGTGISAGSLAGGRLLHAVLTTALACPLLRRVIPAVSAMAQTARPLTGSENVLSLLALLGVFTLLFLRCLPEGQKKLQNTTAACTE